MLNFDFPQLCTKCQGYLTMPYAWNSTSTPRMCRCLKEQSLAWECNRCHKINAPWKDSCDCLPFNPMGTQPSCNSRTYTAGPISLNHYFSDPATNINFDHKDLKNDM